MSSAKLVFFFSLTLRQHGDKRVVKFYVDIEAFFYRAQKNIIAPTKVPITNLSGSVLRRRLFGDVLPVS